MSDTPTHLNRRDALKLGLLGSAAIATGTSTRAEAATKMHAKSSATGKIVIIGAGSAGLSVAARLSSELENPDITIVDATKTHHYQPAYTLIAAGVKEEAYPLEPNADYIPEGVKWVQEMVASVQPESNRLTTDQGNVIAYDYLIVSPGIKLNYQAIEGLSSEVLAAENGIDSIYTHEGSINSWKSLQKMAQMAKTQKVTALFCEPYTGMKCAGATKKILMLSEDYLRKAGVRENVDIRLMTPSGRLFGVDAYNTVFNEIFTKRNIGHVHKIKLRGVDATTKTARFEREDGSDYEQKFDFIQITPPQGTPDFLAQSTLAADNTFMKVDRHTLQSTEYPNIFGLGDCVNTPFGKTGASIRKMYPVVAENVIAQMAGRPLEAKYNGYTACPLLTRYGSAIMVEFGYRQEDGSDTLMPSFPLDPTQERWAFWLLKTVALKPMYYKGMLRGYA
jgi:sulfide:quinone oxidoreductase